MCRYGHTYVEINLHKIAHHHHHHHHHRISHIKQAPPLPPLPPLRLQPSNLSISNNPSPTIPFLLRQAHIPRSAPPCPNPTPPDRYPNLNPSPHRSSQLPSPRTAAQQPSPSSFVGTHILEAGSWGAQGREARGHASGSMVCVCLSVLESRGWCVVASYYNHTRYGTIRSKKSHTER